MFVSRSAAAAAHLAGNSSSRLADPRVRDPIRHIVLEYLWPRSSVAFAFPIIGWKTNICFDSDGSALYMNDTRIEFHYCEPEQRSLKLYGAYFCGNIRLLATDGANFYEACICKHNITHSPVCYTGKIMLQFALEDVYWDSYPISRYGWWRDTLHFFRQDDPTNRYPIALGNNPWCDSGIWYNLTSAGVWTRQIGVTEQYLVGPNEWR